MPLPPILLLTRPEPQARAFAAALDEAGAGPLQTVISPLIGISVTGPLPDLRGIEGVILSSAQGARAYATLGGPPRLPAFCVGGMTTAAAAAAGLDAVTTGQDADALVAALTRKPPPGPLLHLRGRHARGAIAERLTAAGLAVGDAVIYDQPALPPTGAALAALSGRRPVTAPLFSPRTAALFVRLPIKSPLLVAAMSEEVAKPLTALHSLALRRAARPDRPAMLSLTADLLDRARVLEAQEGGE